MKKSFFIVALATSFSAVQAQKRTTQVFDTTKKTVVITSAYKPVLKPVSKINFSASSPAADTARPVFLYSVPAQNLFFTYQPVSLKPLALSTDSIEGMGNHNFIKAGIGNYSTPYLQAGLSFADEKGSVLNVHAKHISQKGNLNFQQYSRSSADVLGILNTEGINEWRGRAGFENSTQYFYGFRPDSLKFTRDQLRQRFTTLNAMVGLRNKQETAFGISYDPTLALNLFSDNKSGSETNLLLKAPVSKRLGENLALKVGFTADVTAYNPTSKSSINNNLYIIEPSVLLKTPNILLNAGFSPSWDNGEFKLLPNFTAQVKLKDEKFVLQGGWIGYFQKNNYQSLAAFNPWIRQPDTLRNNRISEQYAGFKGSAGSHFTYNAKVSLLSYTNQALFINDTIDGKTFRTVYEDMNVVRLHGEIGYTIQEKFSFLAGATLNQFTNLKVNEKAWGLLPIEITGTMRWKVLKDLTVNSDFFFWDGPRYQTKNKETRKQKPAIDLSAGLEFTVLPQLNLWLQFNNVFNNRYQRWNQYEVLGFNVIGGVVYSFSKK